MRSIKKKFIIVLSLCAVALVAAVIAIMVYGKTVNIDSVDVAPSNREIEHARHVMRAKDVVYYEKGEDQAIVLTKPLDKNERAKWKAELLGAKWELVGIDEMPDCDFLHIPRYYVADGLKVAPVNNGVVIENSTLYWLVED